jgi:hypothetical protein
MSPRRRNTRRLPTAAPSPSARPILPTNKPGRSVGRQDLTRHNLVRSLPTQKWKKYCPKYNPNTCSSLLCITKRWIGYRGRSLRRQSSRDKWNTKVVVFRQRSNGLGVLKNELADWRFNWHLGRQIQEGKTENPSTLL